MCDKTIATLALFLALLQSAQADPVQLLSRWERALMLENQILNVTRNVFQKKQSGQLSATYEQCADEIEDILSIEFDPRVLEQVASMALFSYGSTDDRYVDDCKVASFDVSVMRMSRIATAESLQTLRHFRGNRTLDGGASLSVDIAIERLEKTLQALQ